MLPAEHFSQVPEEGQRNSHERVIDLSDPSRRETETILNDQEKNEEMQSLARLAQARAALISTLFERGTKTQDAVRTSELVEESRYWLEDLERQLDFIREHREETGNETAFSEAAASLIQAKKAINSELEHILEVVRLWHEDDPQEEAFTEILAEDAAKQENLEAILQDANDEGTIVEHAPEAKTMLTSEDEQAQATDSVTDSTFLPPGYHEALPANDVEYEGVSPAEEEALGETIKPSKIIDIESHEAFGEKIEPSRIIETGQLPAHLIEIPAGLEETRTAYTALHRTTRDIETSIKRNPQYADRSKFDSYLLDLAHRYSAFEERLTMLERRTGPETDELREEKELIHDALALIEDIRHQIRQINFTPKTEQEQQVERLMDLKFAKKQRLESIVDRLTTAIERSGIKNPELYMVEQASGLGSIRRGLMNLFGKKESLINKATLTKLKNEAIQAEQTYFDEAYNGRNDKALPEYEKAVKNSVLLKLKDTDDVHEVWQALHHEMEELGEQVEAPEALQLHEGEGEAKASNARHNIEVAPVKEAARNQRSEGIAYRRNELKTIKNSDLRNAERLLSIIKNDAAASELTFLPEDYLGAIAELKIANRTKNIEKIEALLPRAQSMKDEMLDLWIDTTNEDGEPVYDDIAVLERAKKLISEGKKKTTSKK